MISRQQYEILCGISDSCPMRVSVKFGHFAWATISESAVAKLVKEGLLKSAIEGELGDNTLVFTPTPKASAAKLEYEESTARGRKVRGR